MLWLGILILTVAAHLNKKLLHLATLPIHGVCLLFLKLVVESKLLSSLRLFA